MTATRRRPRRLLALVAALLAVASVTARAQEAPSATTRRGQVWVGYRTQTRFAPQRSWWNDAHLAPGGFFILRTGLTVHLPADLALTGGYAVLGLPVSEVPLDLKRPEHRPWGQLVYRPTLSERWRTSQRLRYDARFRRNLDAGALARGYTLTHRVQWMATVRDDLPGLAIRRATPYLSVGDELLVNFGPVVARNRIDPNRAFAAVGLVTNHPALVWVFHTIDLRRAPEPQD